MRSGDDPMAQMTICDRCKKPINNILNNSSKNVVILKLVDVDAGPHQRPRHRDLCKACANEVDRFASGEGFIAAQ